MRHRHISIISPLLTTLLCKEPWIRIDLYGKADRFDTSECWAEWDIPEISEKIYSDAEILAKENEVTEEYELEQIWISLAAKYAEALEHNIGEIILSCKVYEELGCSWHFGKYLGNTTVIRGGEENAIL